MLRDPDGLPVLRGVRTEIDWAERIRRDMLNRFAAKPEVVEMLKSIESAGWFVLNRDNLTSISESSTTQICCIVSKMATWLVSGTLAGWRWTWPIPAAA